uniref:Wings apart-like protein homolog n=1 Tax=Phallusia mammillata TaxID=59560 RepID=A0A6F9DW64_9ASCI|nr:wings apart-like protein homolog [Phallusia mammillata]
MKSSNPRTYSRKRKETAESKFDALFSSGEQKIMVEVDEIKKKRLKPTSEVPVMSTISNRLIKIEYAVNGTKRSPTKNVTEPQNRNSAAEKFDALFGPSSPVKLAKPSITNRTPANESDDEGPVELSRSGYTPRSNETKYDVLFKKNEKSASDKFDALFGDDPVPDKTSDTKETSQKSPDFDNMFGFGDTNSESNTFTSSQSPHTKCTSGKSSPTKTAKTLPTITAATMKTIDGKVVLNIQRGGKKTPLHSPTKSSKTNDSMPVKHNHPDKALPEENGSDNVSKSNMSEFEPSVDSKNRTVPNKTSNISFPTNNPGALIDNKVSASSSPGKKKSNLRKFSKAVANTDKQAGNVKPSYNSRPWVTDSERSSQSNLDDNSESQPLSQPISKSENSGEVVPKLTRATTWPENVGESIVTSLKCNKNAKAYYTVVKHVKNYQNCLEEGEAQEFEDDVEYLLEGLQPSQPFSIRCLSATNLASKCQQHNFRLYLRAHNISIKVFSHLQDATSNKSLALATAALLFMLSRDRRMEIDKVTLQLLLKLLDPLEREPAKRNGSPAKETQPKKGGKYKFFKSKGADAKTDDEKTFASVESKIEEMVESCGDALLSGKDADMKRLASEALLRFTARRTTEWFREEIRIKGGLDHIISLVKSNVDILVPSTLVTEQYEQTLSLLERILKVLENGIVNSPRNSMYLVTHQRALLLKKMASLLKLCQQWLIHHPGNTSDPGESGDAKKSDKTYMVLYNCVVQIVRLLVNISNDSEWISNKVGDQEDMLPCIVKCTLTTPHYLKESHRYEISLLGLGLLVNLVESSAKNRMLLMKMEIPPAGAFPSSGSGDAPSSLNVVQALVQLFYEREDAARDNEVLGEEGVKKAVEAKRNESQSSDSKSSSSSQRMEFKADAKDGRWVESEDGMEWVPAEDGDEHSLGGSQESVRSTSRNPEAGLTTEEKAQMQDTLNKANEHMEHSIMASHAALVLGCLIHGNRGNVTTIRAHLRGTSDFEPMISMLKKFLSFMSMTAGMSQKGEKTLIQIIEDLEEENLSPVQS